MKSFKEYLTESQKIYTHKVKVAGKIVDDFEGKLKEALTSYEPLEIKKESETPIQRVPLDFPDLRNQEVSIFSVQTQYPITPPEIASIIKEFDISEEKIIVRNSMDPSEVDQATKGELLTDETLLTNTNYEELTNAESKEYFGDEYNTNFLKDLENQRKETQKEEKNKDFGHALSAGTEEK